MSPLYLIRVFQAVAVCGTVSMDLPPAGPGVWPACQGLGTGKLIRLSSTPDGEGRCLAKEVSIPPACAKTVAEKSGSFATSWHWWAPGDNLKGQPRTAFGFVLTTRYQGGPLHLALGRNLPPAPMGEIFSDGFESGDLAEWSRVVP